MPVGKIRTTDSPTGKVRTTDNPIGQIKTTDNPIGLIRTTDSPIGKIGHSGILIAESLAKSFAGKGYLIGMLALTYSKVQTRGVVSAVFQSEDRPIVNIRTTD